MYFLFPSLSIFMQNNLSQGRAYVLWNKGVYYSYKLTETGLVGWEITRAFIDFFLKTDKN